MKRTRIPKKLSLPVLILVLVAAAVIHFTSKDKGPAYSASVMDVPVFSGEPYVIIHDNQPEFKETDYTTKSYEFYSELDSLGRCGYAIACIGQDIMPTEDRGSIGQVKPSGWQTVKYDFVDGKYLYNRCHLIGYQLTGENANEANLITGTRYLNVEGMLPFEDMVADYIKESGNHVLYRVTPVFDGTDLVARGVQMEGWSVEDSGAGICFNVYCYNEQPGVTIDHATGSSTLSGETGTGSIAESTAAADDAQTYILNTSSMRFHTSDCSQGQGIKESNKQSFTGDREDLIRQDYTPSGCCKP